MTEARLPAPVRAIPLNDEAFYARSIPGSFCLGERDEDGELLFFYRCPCGCGVVSALIVGDGFKPTTGPSWQWNGSLAGATLHPSVWHRGHFHGWLRNGVWVNA